MNLQYIVTGTGRCGTVYLARLLTNIGIPCGHESIFDTGGIEDAFKRLAGEKTIELSEASCVDHITRKKLEPWVNPKTLIADSSYMAAPFLSEDILANATIIHIVRHPTNVIRSFVKDFHYFKDEPTKLSIPYQKFIYQHLPELVDFKDPIVRASHFYIEWNKRIEEQCKGRTFYFHRIEDPIDKLCEFLNKDVPQNEIPHRNSLRKSNAPKSKIEFPNIEARNRVVNIMKDYGYVQKPIEKKVIPMI